jgi:hypothetical protein
MRLAGNRVWWGVFVVAFALGVAPAQADDPAGTDPAEADVDESTATSDAVFESLVAEVAAHRGDSEGALEI